MSTFPERLKAAREARSLSPQALATAAGIDRVADVYEYERPAKPRGRESRVDKLDRIATALGVSLEWLLTGKQEHAPEWARTDEWGRSLAEVDEIDTTVSPPPAGPEAA